MSRLPFILWLSLLRLFVSSSCSAQDCELILKKSFTECQKIRNGYLEMTKYSKYMDRHDTIPKFITCYFNKLCNDQFFSSVFHYKEFSNGECNYNVIYTGENAVILNQEDRSAEVIPALKWPEKIRST